MQFITDGIRDEDEQKIFTGHSERDAQPLPPSLSSLASRNTWNKFNCLTKAH
jgi:hypothetical protein